MSHFPLSEITGRIFKPYEVQLDFIKQDCITKLNELSGGGSIIYRGTLFIGSSIHFVPTPPELCKLLDDYLALVESTSKNRAKFYSYLIKAVRKDLLDSRQLLRLLPANCHHLFSHLDPYDTPNDSIPNWVVDIVNTSLMLRTLYELP